MRVNREEEEEEERKKSPGNLPARPAERGERVFAPVWEEEQLISFPFSGGTRRAAPPGPASSAPV